MSKKFKPGSYMLPLTGRVKDLEEEVFADENTDNSLKQKARSVSEIKKVAEEQGKPITSQEITKAMSSLLDSINLRIKDFTLQASRSVLPIGTQIKQINDLILSNKEEDRNKAFDLIDDLQERVGLDLSKFSKEVSDGIYKLYDMNKKDKEKKLEEKRIHEEKITTLKEERDILRERGINTYVDEKNYKLQLKTKAEEKQEIKEIQKQEKFLKEREKELLFEEKQIKKEKKIDADRAERFFADQENLTRDQIKLQERKEKAGLKPQENAAPNVCDKKP